MSTINNSAGEKIKRTRQKGILVSRNVRIGSRRTSMRLEPALWNALDEICRREGISRNELCTKIAHEKTASASLTSWIRIYIVNYFLKLANGQKTDPLISLAGRQRIGSPPS